MHRKIAELATVDLLDNPFLHYNRKVAAQEPEPLMKGTACAIRPRRKEYPLLEKREKGEIRTY